jgi:hypothetical protein
MYALERIPHPAWTALRSPAAFFAFIFCSFLSKAYTLHAYIDGFGQHHCDLTAINAEHAQRYRQLDKCDSYLKRHFTFHITLTSLNLQTLYLKG